MISPLYVYSGIFPNGIQHEDDMLAALSLVFYAAITLIPVIKYVFIVLRANDNGEVLLSPSSSGSPMIEMAHFLDQSSYLR
ncbi:potassium transporter 19 [Quercus suber]|uniref:Potassium transporter 19 n=1 Tax=Quercus suber TaxID=58331 RepID=A0AAW0J4B9_QUESU